MKLGKISNTIYDRSVFKLLSKRGKSKVAKPLAGQDAQVVGKTVVSTAFGRYPVYQVANNIAASGGRLAGVSLAIVLDEKAREIRLKEVISEMERQCAKADVQITGVSATVSTLANKPLTTVTGVGELNKPVVKAKPGQDIILTKCIGLSGIRAIVDAKRDEILKLYSEDVIERALGEEDELLTLKEAETFARSQEDGTMFAVSEGGVFAALWNMAELSGAGLDIDFRSIPVRQEIIEICEIFNVNPYELESLGCLLMTSYNGCDIINNMSEMGISATVIGKVTEGNNRIIHNIEEDRFLSLPEQDEVYKFI